MCAWCGHSTTSLGVSKHPLMEEVEFWCQLEPKFMSDTWNVMAFMAFRTLLKRKSVPRSVHSSCVAKLGTPFAYPKSNVPFYLETFVLTIFQIVLHPKNALWQFDNFKVTLSYSLQRNFLHHGGRFSVKLIRARENEKKISEVYRTKPVCLAINVRCLQHDSRIQSLDTRDAERLL